MFIVGYFLMAIARVCDVALLCYLWIVIARAVLSWVSPDPYNPIVRFVHSVTEPALSAVRRRLPIFFGGIDFSPMIIVLGIMFLRIFLVNTLFRLSKTLL